MKRITEPQAMKIMQKLLDNNMDESMMCPYELQSVLEQHHNIYLRYVTIRDNRK